MRHRGRAQQMQAILILITHHLEFNRPRTGLFTFPLLHPQLPQPSRWHVIPVIPQQKPKTKVVLSSFLLSHFTSNPMAEIWGSVFKIFRMLRVLPLTALALSALTASLFCLGPRALHTTPPGFATSCQENCVSTEAIPTWWFLITLRLKPSPNDLRL